MVFTKKCLTIALSGMSFIATAQQKTPKTPVTPPKAQVAVEKSVAPPTVEKGLIWTKRISRVVSLSDTEVTLKSNLRKESTDKPLAEILTEAVKNGKAIAYAGTDSRFTKQLTKSQLNELFITKQDTIVVEDPVTGNRLTKVITTDFDFSKINKFRILEEWTFDRQAYKTTVQIIGIAPVREIYGSDGMFRGTQSMYWVKHTEVKDIILNYEQIHPECNISLSVWNDYFGNQD